jgi:hypothetical protein
MNFRVFKHAKVRFFGFARPFFLTFAFVIHAKVQFPTKGLTALRQGFGQRNEMGAGSVGLVVGSR